MLIIGHRGCLHPYKENTLKAFEQALLENVDMVEFDVQVTADNQIVVFHDLLVDRLTGLSGPLKDFSYSDLQGFDVPLFGEVLNLLGKKCGIYIEIKGIWSDNELLELLSIVEDHIQSDIIDRQQIYYGSFNNNYCKFIAGLEQNYKIGYISCDNVLPSLEGYFFVCLYTIVLDEKVCQIIQKSGCQLWVFTIKTVEELHLLEPFKNYIDGLVVDYPEKIIKYLNNLEEDVDKDIVEDQRKDKDKVNHIHYDKDKAKTKIKSKTKTKPKTKGKTKPKTKGKINQRINMTSK